MKQECFIELRPGHHQRVLEFCIGAARNGQPWLRLDAIEEATGHLPAAGAIMKLKREGLVRTRAHDGGTVEIAATTR